MRQAAAREAIKAATADEFVLETIEGNRALSVRILVGTPFSRPGVPPVTQAGLRRVASRSRGAPRVGRRRVAIRMKKQDIGVPFGHIWAGAKTGSRQGRVLVEPYSRARRPIRPLAGRYSWGAFDLQSIPAFAKMLG